MNVDNVIKVLLTTPGNKNQELWALWEKMSNNTFFYYEPNSELGKFFYDLSSGKKDSYFEILAEYKDSALSALNVFDKKNASFVGQWSTETDHFGWRTKASVSVFGNYKWNVYTKYHNGNPITQVIFNDKLLGYVFHKEPFDSITSPYKSNDNMGPLSCLPQHIIDEYLVHPIHIGFNLS